MLSSITFEGHVDDEDRIRIYAEDRDLRLEELHCLYPRLGRHLFPSELVESVITDICHYAIEERPLPRAQLALCDVQARKIRVNSRVRDFVDIKKVNLLALRRSTMAHELGHVRLHQDEMEQRTFLSSYGAGGRFEDPRARQKEFEADLYGAVFLVPLERLKQTAAFQALEKARLDERKLKSGQIWMRVYQLSDIFGTTPTLMCRSLRVYGWLRQKPSRRHGLHDLELIF